MVVFRVFHRQRVDESPIRSQIQNQAVSSPNDDESEMGSIEKFKYLDEKCDSSIALPLAIACKDGHKTCFKARTVRPEG